MTNKVLILGASGRFGRAATQAFSEQGWNVTTLSRPGGKKRAHVFDGAALAGAAEGMDVIVNALNPAYPDWSRDLPRLKEAVIHAAHASGASVMIPGNVYNYGAAMPPVLREETPHKPTTKKGQLREEMEQAFREAVGDGVQTIVLRCGDFLEREQTGNWFDTYIANKADKGVFTYPGDPDIAHAWAYLPDAARAMTLLAEKRDVLGSFEMVNFAGNSFTGNELRRLTGVAVGRELKLKKVPWQVLRVMALFSRTMREVQEMRYLWDVPHELDGAKLKEIAPEFEPTPVAEMMLDLMGGMRAASITAKKDSLRAPGRSNLPGRGRKRSSRRPAMSAVWF